MTQQRDNALATVQKVTIDALDLTRLHQFTDSYVDSLIAAGATAVHVTVTLPRNGFREAVGDLLNWRSEIEQRPDRFILIHNVDDLYIAQRDRRLGIILGMQDSHACEGDVRLLQVFHQLGLRCLQLTYNRMNLAGTGCVERIDAGLSTFGQELVAELNQLGIIIDLAHASDRTVMDTLEISKDPVMISHTGCRSFTGRMRGSADEIIRAVAASGGVIGIAATSLALHEKGLTQGARLADYLDNIEHVISLAGSAHVGIGLDIVYPDIEGQMMELMRRYPDWQRPSLKERYVQELYAPSGRFNTIASGLAERGHQQDTIDKVLGSNFLRVFNQIW